MAFSAPGSPLSSTSTSSNGRADNCRSESISSIQSPHLLASVYDPLCTALSTAQSRYTIRNGQSLKAHNEACQDFPGGNTRTVLHTSPFPITFAQGKGCELTSLDGDVYIDFLGEFTAGIFGHSNELIASAVSEAMEKGWNYGGPNPYERDFGRKVTKRFSPSGIELVRFTNSGTESNTMAIAAAVAFTGRKKILVFTNGYHGGTLHFPTILSATTVNLPHDFILAPYNDIPGTHSIISGLPSESLAAILVEPVQGSGGCIVGRKDFLKYLNATAHRLGALFIMDEVMTSRLSYHGLSSELGLNPDLVTLGKWIGGGMTFGAFGGRREGPMAMFNPRDGGLSHSGTFNNNIITMAAGSAGMDIYNEQEVLRLNALGERLKEGIQQALAKYGIKSPSQDGPRHLKTEIESPITGTEAEFPDKEIGIESLSLPEQTKLATPMWVTGQGSMIAIHFAGENEKSFLALLWHQMLEHGIYMAQRGFIALNLELTEKHVEKFVASIDEFIGKYQQALIS